jgi:hypothetical protein
VIGPPNHNTLANFLMGRIPALLTENGMALTADNVLFCTYHTHTHARARALARSLARLCCPLP